MFKNTNKIQRICK